MKRKFQLKSVKTWLAIITGLVVLVTTAAGAYIRYKDFVFEVLVKPKVEIIAKRIAKQTVRRMVKDEALKRRR